MASVGSELLNEIERVSAKRERWKGYGMGASGAPGIFLMTQAIDRGKQAAQSADPVEAIAALEDLRGFDSDD
jgi:hypothetical protein